RAVELAPDDPDVRLLQATLFRLTGRPQDAHRVLESATHTSPNHLKTLYALAELDSARRREYLGRVVDIAPANVPAQLSLAEALLNTGDTIGARDHLELLRQRLPQRNPNAVVNAIRFRDVTAGVGLGSVDLRNGTVAVGDFDGDGQTDLLVASSAGVHVYRNDHGRFKAIAGGAGGAGIASLGSATAAIVGDYDNDGHVDVLLMGNSGILLLH